MLRPTAGGLPGKSPPAVLPMCFSSGNPSSLAQCRIKGTNKRTSTAGVGEGPGVALAVGVAEGPATVVEVCVGEMTGVLVAVGGAAVWVGVGVFVGGCGKGVKVGVGVPGELYS